MSRILRSSSTGSHRLPYAVHLLHGRNFMARFIPLTLMSKTQKATLYLNMDQVRYLRPQTSGGTTIYFGDEQSVMVEEDAATVASMVRANNLLSFWAVAGLA